MADDVIKKRDPLAKKAVGEKAVEEVKEKHPKSPGSITSLQSTTAAKVPSPVRAQVRRYIFQRDQCCQFRKADGSICGSRYQLELDHITPQFAGGSHDVANLRADFTIKSLSKGGQSEL